MHKPDIYKNMVLTKEHELVSLIESYTSRSNFFHLLSNFLQGYYPEEISAERFMERWREIHTEGSKLEREIMEKSLPFVIAFSSPEEQKKLKELVS